MTAENASHWRELAVDLHAEDVEILAGIERGVAATDGGTAANRFVMDCIRRAMAEQCARELYADVEIPAGAKAGQWEADPDGVWRPLLWGQFGGAEVDGRQKSDGSYTRFVAVWVGRESVNLDAGAARALAAHLLSAADLLDFVTRKSARKRRWWR
jgi:hypothetical protein